VVEQAGTNAAGTMMSVTEKRKFTRIPFQTEIKITAGEVTHVSNKLRDISLGGAFIFMKEALPESIPCVLDVELRGPASLLRIQVEGEIVRVEDDGIAVKFTRIDLDSLLHLKHLIRVLTQDAELIDHEFSANLLEVK
jgi:c-di-GMP-binding flagellar brake protein YcgR